MEKPFAENSKDLLVLDSRYLADPAVIDTIVRSNLLDNQYVVNQIKPITNPLKRNNLLLFNREVNQEHNYNCHQCSLFSGLYIASEIRNGYLDQVFLA